MPLNSDRSPSKIQKYLDVYNEAFGLLEDKPIKLLELGIYEGKSLLMWSDFFKKGSIIGLDIALRQPLIERPEERIKMYQGDQTNRQLLEKIHRMDGPFDIIIDDASHIGKLTKKSFEILFPLLKSGGFYVIEDWGTGYWESTQWDGAKPEPGKNHLAGMVGVVKSVIDIIGIPDINKGTPEVIDYMRVSYGQAIIKKA